MRKVIRLLLIAATAVIVFKFIFVPVRITGTSMAPTYRDGRFTFINRLVYLTRPPARGDIVAIRTSGLKVMYLKRIIALPGETVAIDDGQVTINGQPLAEPYLIHPGPWQIPPVTLAPAEYYVIGDNRQVVVEEHLFGRVERSRIVGRALW